MHLDPQHWLPVVQTAPAVLAVARVVALAAGAAHPTPAAAVRVLLTDTGQVNSRISRILK